MSYKDKSDKGKKSPKKSQILGVEKLESRSRGLSIEEENSPRKQRGTGTPISRAYFETVTVPRQDRTLFDELEERNRDYREAIGKNSLIVRGILGLPLSIRGQLVFRELLETAITKNLGRLHSLPKIDKERIKREPARNIEDNYSVSLVGTINLLDLAKRATGGERGTDIQNTRDALAEFLNKKITIQDSDGTLRVITPVSIQEEIYNKGKKGDPTKIIYTLHPIFTLALSSQFVRLTPSYIFRGQRLPNWGYNLVSLLWYRAQGDLNNRIYWIKKSDLFEQIINLPEDMEKYKKNPQRKKQGFEKIISRLREVKLLIPGTHKNEEGGTVSDDGYFETISHRDGSVICNFRLRDKEELTEILLADENERFKLL